MDTSCAKKGNFYLLILKGNAEKFILNTSDLTDFAVFCDASWNEEQGLSNGKHSFRAI